MFSPRSLRHCGGSGKGRGAEITPHQTPPPAGRITSAPPCPPPAILRNDQQTLIE